MDHTHSRCNQRLVGGLLLLITFICASLLMAPGASAHSGGLFQPSVKDLVVDDDGTDAGRTVWVRIADADGGKPAFGFRAFITAGGISTSLTEVAAGYYAGRVNLAEGPVALGLNLRSAPGGDLVAKFVKSFNITVPPANQRLVVQGRGEEAGFAAAQTSSLHQERLDALERGKGLNVRLEEFQDDTLVSPLWVRIHVFVEDRATAKLDPTEYEVYGYAVDAQGNETEFARFSPLDAIDRQYEPGTYGGVVILPHGGKWSMKANVLSLRDEMKGPPVFITTGELLVERGGPPAAQGGGAPAARSATDRLADSRAKANVPNVILLVTHTLAAGAWGLITGLFLLLAFQRARALSTWARNLMERNLDVLVRAAYVSTAVVIGTGVWNLYRVAPYGMPGSVGELSDFMDLSFGRPYYLSLGGKLTAYAVLLYGSFRLIHSARAELRASGPGHRRAAAGTGNPWLKRQPGDPVPEAAAAGGPRQPWSRPVTEQPAMSMTVVLEAEAPAEAPPAQAVQAAPASTKSRFRMALLPVMAVSTLVLVVCIAILKYAHVLIEVARLS